MTDMGFIPDDKDLNKSLRPARDGDSPVPPDDESFFAGADPLAEYEDVSDAPNRLTETEDRQEMRDSTADESDAPTVGPSTKSHWSRTPSPLRRRRSATWILPSRP